MQFHQLLHQHNTLTITTNIIAVLLHRVEMVEMDMNGIPGKDGSPGKDGDDFSSLKLLREAINETVVKGK